MHAHKEAHMDLREIILVLLRTVFLIPISAHLELVLIVTFHIPSSEFGVRCRSFASIWRV